MTNFFDNIKKGKKYLIGIICLLPVLGFCFYIGFSPLYSLKQINSLSHQDKQFMEKFDSSFFSGDLTNLIREKSYKQAFARASDNDSIILFLDLEDSIAGLSINGVKLHQIPISSFKADKLLSRLDNLNYSYLFSKPLRITDDYATIVKEPIIEKKAPKDSIEALNSVLQPDSLVMGPVFIDLDLGQNIKVIFEQEKNSGQKDRWKKLTFRGRVFINRFFKYAGDCISFRKPEYASKIEVKIPAAELGEFYRALPDKGLVVIRLPLPN